MPLAVTALRAGEQRAVLQIRDDLRDDGVPAVAGRRSKDKFLY